MKILFTLAFCLFMAKSGYAAESNFLQQVWDDAKKLGNTVVESVESMTKQTGKQEKPAPQTADQGVDSPVFQEVWSDFSDVASEAIDLATKSDKNSRTTLEFLTAQEPKYVRLLRKAQDILSNSAAREQFESIYGLQKTNRKLSAESIELKRKRISAPAESMNPLVKTRKSIDERLAEIPILIAHNENQIDALQDEILEILHNSGVNISRDELKYFIISAEGNEMINLINIADNMIKMQTVIERELDADRNNIELAKVYTGMYLVSLEAYVYAHQAVQKNIVGYRERIQHIIAEAEANYNEAVRLKKRASEADKKHLDANISISERTIHVATLYDGLLQRRVAHLKKSQAAAEEKVLLAKNTYKTMVNGSSLISLVNSGSQEYALLVNFEMPELRTIYDAAMLNAFTEISEKIKQEE